MGVVAISGFTAGSSPGSPKLVTGNAEADFMRLSALLIPHRLDALTGARIMVGLGADRSPMNGHVTELLALARSRHATEAEDFFPFATGPAKAAALAIISAWYLGVAENIPGARVFANVDALMYGPTSDVMTIPSYATAGPSDWGQRSTPLAFMPSF